MSGGIIDTSQVLQVQNVRMDFPVSNGVVTPIQHADFSIQANSFNIIYGASGSGKSTLLNTMAGLQPPTQGKVIVQGADLYAMDNQELSHFRANRVGFIHQTNEWVKSLTVLDNVAIPLYSLGFSRSKAAKLAMNSLERVHMQEYAKKYPSVLSGGEQQRLAMARALVNEPLFVIADEPTGNLDTSNGDKIMHLLLECQTIFRSTIILVTHNMEYISFAEHLLNIQNHMVEDIQKADTATIANKLLYETKLRIDALARMKAEAINGK